MQLVEDCCERKSPDEFCDGCRLSFALFFMHNEKAVMRYLAKHNPKLYQEVRHGTYKL